MSTLKFTAAALLALASAVAITAYSAEEDGDFGPPVHAQA